MTDTNNYVDDDIDDVVDDKKNNINEVTKQEQEIEKLLSSLGGLDNTTLNKLAEMKDMSDINNLDLKKLRQMFSKMNIDKNKLKSLKEKMEQADSATKDSTPLTRDELRKKLREKTKLMRKTRLMK